MGPRTTVFQCGLLASLFIFASVPAALRAQGVALSGVGPVNRAMGGAATAAPIDAAGALMWNPGSINALSSSEVDIGLELLLPTEKLASSAFGAQGSTGGEPGAMAIPELAWVHKCDDSPWAYGIGIGGIGGFATNYPASTTNPVLKAQPLGLGQISSLAEYYQVVPTVSYALNDRLSFGFAPSLTIGKLDVTPEVFAAPDPTYPESDGTRYHFGGGFQLGLYYQPTDAWAVGFCFKSPQWFERYTANTMNSLGQPEVVSMMFDYPMIISLGTSYRGLPGWLFACDVRYFNYAGTPGWGSPAAFAPDGAVLGLGWKDIVSVHTGVQYFATDRLALRMGYQFNQNPISTDAAFFNVASPLILEHVLGIGCSYRLTEHEIISLAYLHGFQNESTGPIQLPGIGVIPGTSVSSSVSADALAAGLTVQY